MPSASGPVKKTPLGRSPLAKQPPTVAAAVKPPPVAALKQEVINQPAGNNAEVYRIQNDHRKKFFFLY